MQSVAMTTGKQFPSSVFGKENPKKRLQSLIVVFWGFSFPIFFLILAWLKE